MSRGIDRHMLIEAAASAWRARDVQGRIAAHPAWHDLDAEGRREAFAAAKQMRALEAAADPQGLSAAGRAVLSRILKAGG